MIMVTKELIRSINLKLSFGIFVFLLVTVSKVKSQSFSYTVKCIENIMPVNDFDTIYSHQCILDLNDTINIDSIRVKIGSTLQSNDVLDYAFVFDQSTFLPEGLAYYRKKARVTLELGNHLEGDFYYRVSIIDTLGVESSIVPWNNKTP